MIYKYAVKSEGFSGAVTVDVPKYTDRLRLLKDVNFSIGDKELDKTSGVESMIRMIELAPNYIKEVDVIRLADGKKYTSFEELNDDADEVCVEITKLVFEGVKLGKS